MLKYFVYLNRWVERYAFCECVTKCNDKYQEYDMLQRNLSPFYREERAGCFVLFFVLVSRDRCMTLPNDATGLSAVCNCGII